MGQSLKFIFSQVYIYWNEHPTLNKVIRKIIVTDYLTTTLWRFRQQNWYVFATFLDFRWHCRRVWTIQLTVSSKDKRKRKEKRRERGEVLVVIFNDSFMSMTIKQYNIKKCLQNGHVHICVPLWIYIHTLSLQWLIIFTN